MAEEKVVETPDIEEMSDAQVADLKKTMREAPKSEPETDESEPAVAADKAKPAADKEGEEDKQDTVPHGQFHRERERRKEAERLSSIATQRLAELLEASKPAPQTQQQADPDPEPGDDDPLAQLAWTRRQLNAIRGDINGQRQQAQQSQQVEGVVNLVAQRFAAKTAEQPELQHVANYLAGSFAREFAAAGVQGMGPNGQIIPNSPVQQAVVDHVKKIALYCYQNNIPIEDYYASLAAARGWRSTDAGQQQNGAPRNADGTFAKQQAEAIDKLEATKQKSKSLGGSGAPVDLSEVTPETLVNMSDDDFIAFKKKYGEKAMRRAFGAVH